MTDLHDHGPGPEEDPSIHDRFRTALLTGAALTVPIAVTVWVIAFIVRFIVGQLDPFVGVIAGLFGVSSDVAIVAIQLASVGAVVVLWVALGLAVQTTTGQRIERWVNDQIGRIPGVGPVYSSFMQMSELMLESDSVSFRKVVLVEYPHEGSYTIAFLTAEAPTVVREATDSESMRAVFMPMAPNPFMGGFVLYVTESRVYDVDMTVEEGVRAVVTSGVVVGDAEEPADVPDVDSLTERV